MSAYMTQGKTGSLGTFGDHMTTEDTAAFVQECEAGGAAIERSTHAGHETIKAVFGDMTAFIVVCKSQGDFYRAAKSAGVL